MRNIVVGALVGSIAVIVACVGEDPALPPANATGDGGIPVGEYGGKCSDDGRCEAGLNCIDGIICLRPDDARDAGPTDGSPGDSGPDASSCSLVAPPLSANLRCPSDNAYVACPANQLCCMGGDASCTATPSACAGGTLWACFATDQCPAAGFHCCTKGKLETSDGPCGRFEPTPSTCAAKCSNEDIELCSTDPAAKPCPPGATCRVVSTSLGFALGICQLE